MAVGVNVYVVMINDRHCDPEPVVFSTVEAAEDYARAFVEEAVQHHPECVVEQPQPVPAAWLYYATYCVEGDAVWVIARTVDPEGEVVSS